MEPKVSLFGVGFDPLPSQLSIVVKQAYLCALERGDIGAGDYLDPYDYFTHRFSQNRLEGFNLMGRIDVPSWLRSKPSPGDESALTLDSFAEFTRTGGCLGIAATVEDYIKTSVLPNVFGMIGVDHSTTYGAISALRHRIEKDNLGLVVMDSHFDAVPMDLRFGVAEYAREEGLPVLSHDPVFEDNDSIMSSTDLEAYSNLNMENFILHFLNQDLIDPKNLIVIGISDYPPSEFKNSPHPGCVAYHDFFKSLEDQGVRFFPKNTLQQQGVGPLAEAMEQLEAEHVYISLDMDIGACSSVYACRFLNTIGLSSGLVEDIFDSLFGCFSGNKRLIGFDLMEIDIHKLGVDIQKTRDDNTFEIAGRFLDHVQSVM